MPFLAKGFILFGNKNRFKKYIFEDKQKAQRLYEKMKRKGLDVQLCY